MTVSTTEIAITQAELAVILNGLALANSERLSLTYGSRLISNFVLWIFESDPVQESLPLRETRHSAGIG